VPQEAVPSADGVITPYRIARSFCYQTRGYTLETPQADDRPGLSHENNPWASPTADLEPPPTRVRYRWSALPEGIAVGLVLGLVDIHHAYAGTPPSVYLTYLGVAFVLGVRHGRWAWLAWPPLGVCLYLVHLAAIAHGYKEPYVEANADQAIGCLGVLVPSGLGIGIGAVVRWVLKSLVRLGARTWRNSDPSFWPPSLRGMALVPPGPLLETDERRPAGVPRSEPGRSSRKRERCQRGDGRRPTRLRSAHLAEVYAGCHDGDGRRT
jgi:hypothetical protein